jgi:hypothetical protein
MQAAILTSLHTPLSCSFGLASPQIVFNFAALPRLRVNVQVKDALPLISKAVLTNCHVVRLSNHIHVVHLLRTVEHIFRLLIKVCQTSSFYNGFTTLEIHFCKRCWHGVNLRRVNLG